MKTPPTHTKPIKKLPSWEFFYNSFYTFIIFPSIIKNRKIARLATRIISPIPA